MDLLPCHIPTCPRFSIVLRPAHLCLSVCWFAACAAALGSHVARAAELKAIPPAAAAVEQAVAEIVPSQDPRPDLILAQVERTLVAKDRLDRGLDELLALRPDCYGNRHPRLVQLWQSGQISRRQLRVELVNYYAARQAAARPPVLSAR